MGDLQAAVELALEALPVGDVDQGAVQLALTYAGQVDQGGDLAKLGAGLLACLDALGMTPKARKAVVKGGATSDQPARGQLDELRQRRARKNRAADLDATPPAAHP